MSRRHTDSRTRRAGLALVVAGAAAAFMAPGADAAFTTPFCGGAATSGAGATFQNLAQSAWNNNVYRSGDQCGSSAPAVTYQGTGSGKGRAILGQHRDGNLSGQRDPGPAVISGYTQGVRFGTSDSAVAPTERNQIEAGLDTTTADDAKLHVIPAAVGAITIPVNVPDGCFIDTTTDADRFNPDGASDITNKTGRFKLDKARIVKAFAGSSDMDTWGELLPGIQGADAGATTACQAKPVTRVVRLDSSGTSQVFEKWLNYVKSGGDPTFGTPNDQTWPNAPAVGDPAGGGCLPNPPACSAGENQTFRRGQGNSQVAGKINSVDGSIGYVELADARVAGFSKTPNTGSTVLGDDTFWIPVPNGGNTQVDPSDDPLSYKNGSPGANCTTTVFTDKSNGANTEGTLPSAPAGSTLRSLGDDWSKVDGLNSSSGYGICTLTFELAFDDNAPAFSQSGVPQSDEEKRARTVKDYLGATVSPQGQAVLFGRDYAPLPSTAPGSAPAGTPSVLKVARDAVDAIGFNKAGSSGGGGGTTTPPSNENPPAGGGGGGGGGVTTPPPPGGPPVNAFSLGSVRSNGRTGVIQLTLTLPGPGQIQAVASSTVPARFARVTSAAKKKPKKIRYGKATVNVTAAGAVKVSLKPSAAAKKALKKGAKLKVSVKLTYTPKGGTASTKTKTVTVTGKKAKKAGSGR